MYLVSDIFKGCVWLRSRDLMTHNGLVRSEMMFPDNARITARIDSGGVNAFALDSLIELDVLCPGQAALHFTHRGTRAEVMTFLPGLRALKRTDPRLCLVLIDYSDADPFSVRAVPFADLPASAHKLCNA